MIMPARFVFSYVLVVLILIVFLFLPCAGAQSQRPFASLMIAQNEYTGEADTKNVNHEAVEKLRRMTPEEIKALDKKLAEALVLYYDRKFASALPIFKEIAGQVETMDIMFWLGTSAMKVGETDLALRHFKKMLDIDPRLHRVRLDLATTYFSMGRYDDARRELEIVKEASPPPGVQKNIEKLLAAIDERTRKVSWNLRLSQGILWDDNINSGPEQKAYPVIGGTLTPGTLSSKLSDEASVTNIAGNLLYNIGEPKGLMWNTTASFYNKSYFEYSQFDYLNMDITTGPWWVGRRDIVKVPFGFSSDDYENDRLSYAYHFDPNYEHHFSRYFSLKGLYSYRDERYYSVANDDLDNISRRVELTPRVYLVNRKHTFSATIGYENRNADADRFSYDGPYYAVSYFTRFPTSTEFFMRYQRMSRGYDGKPILYNRYREDVRQTVTAVLSQGFYKYFFASLAFSFMDNNSNLELYDYDKTTYTVSVGCRF